MVEKALSHERRVARVAMGSMGSRETLETPDKVMPWVPTPLSSLLFKDTGVPSKSVGKTQSLLGEILVSCVCPGFLGARKQIGGSLLK